MKKLKVAVLGASGRTGGEVVRLLSSSEGSELSAALVEEGCASIGKRCYSDSSNPTVYSANLEEGIRASDAVIEFAVPEASEKTAKICKDLKKPLLVATTGHTESQLEGLRRVGESAPFLMVSNTSIGIFVLSEVARLAKGLLGSGFDIEIVESHHRMKKDAPSGTGLTLAKALGAGAEDRLVSDRTSAPKVRGDKEIGIVSIRGGSVAGDHTIHFLGQGERLELKHVAEDRSIFARGAIRMIEKLAKKGPGIYSVKDLIQG